MKLSKHTKAEYTHHFPISGLEPPTYTVPTSHAVPTDEIRNVGLGLD